MGGRVSISEKPSVRFPVHFFLITELHSQRSGNKMLLQVRQGPSTVILGRCDVSSRPGREKEDARRQTTLYVQASSFVDVLSQTAQWCVVDAGSPLIVSAFRRCGVIEKLLIGIAAIVAMLAGAAIGAMAGAFLSGSRVEVQTARIPVLQVANVDQHLTSEQQVPATMTPYPTYTPFPTQTPYPTYTAAPVPTLTPQATLAPRPTLTPTIVVAVLNAASPPQVLVVADTGGSGVFIRRTPANSDKIIAWPDGTRMIVVGPDTQSEGRTWKRVKDPAGNEGWVPSEYLFTPDAAARILSPRR